MRVSIAPAQRRSSSCSPWSLSLLLVVLCFDIGGAYDPENGFALGIYGPITKTTQDDLAAAVLFDLDFRKNRDPELRARLGPPIVEIPNLHPDLKFKIQLGASNGEKTTGVETALDWLYGNGNGTQQVVGIVGGYYSAISMPIASVCEVFKTPQIAFGSTNRMLSDKTLYPWFLRTIAPDNFQGQAMWAWMNVAGVPSVIFFYRMLEAYGEGLFQVTLDLAFEAGQPSRVSSVGVDLTGVLEEDRTAMINRLDAIKGLGTKFIIMVFSSPGYATLGMYAMEQQDMLYSTHQLLGSDSFGIVDSYPYPPSQGLPPGCMTFTPVTAGKLHSRFVATWQNMTPQDVYSAEARRRYLIDNFHAPLDSAGTRKLEASDFTDRLPWFFSNFLVDAAYSFAIAINNLLNAGLTPSQVYGDRLLAELRALSFEGVTGVVAFDGNADRIADWELWNVKELRGPLKSVAVWLATESNMMESIQFHDPNSQELLWITGDVRLKAPRVLTTCALGQRWDDTAGLCIFCQLNEEAFLDDLGTPSCKACALGRVSAEPVGALNCTECPPGTFRDSNTPSCTSCAPGTSMAAPGQSACVDCVAGRFAPEPGALECEICGGSTAASLTTMDRVIDSDGQQTLIPKVGAHAASFCGCRPGYRENGFGDCVPCKEGMICKGLNETFIQEGYYADAVSPATGDLSVFKCFGEPERCAGGLPGHTCSAGREGLTCAECQDGKTPKSGGSCVECERSDVGPFIALVVAGVASLVAAYYLVDTQNRVTQSHALLLCACALGQLVTVTQQLGVVGQLAATWDEPVQSFMRFLKLLALDLEVLRLNCVGNVTPRQRFQMKITIIFISIAIMLGIHAVFVGLRHRCHWRRHMNSLVGSTGMLFMVFNIAVTSAVLQPFQCEKHPNGKWTVRPYPSVLCWDDDDDHIGMVVEGAVAFILVPVAFLAVCVHVVHQFPRRMKEGDADFLQSFAFLFFRFRAAQHWYVVYQMLRNFGVALVLIIPDSVLQVFVLQSIVLMGFSSTLYLWPWRVDYANIMDCIFGACTLIIVGLAGIFLDDDQKHSKGVGWLTMVFICLCLLCTPFAVAHGLYVKYCRSKKPYQFFLCHHKMGSGAFVRLLKMQLQECPQLRSDVFVDSDNLQNLDRLFDHVGNDTENLVVVCTERVFTRPWCIGEMCVASAKGVSVILIKMPDYVLPDEKFIAELRERLSDLEVLTESGISEEMVASTLRWIPDNPRISMSETVTIQSISMLAMRLFLKEPVGSNCSMIIETQQASSQSHSDESEGSNNDEDQTLMLYDCSNMEAASTALVLRKLLTPHLTHNTKKIPQPIEDVNNIHISIDSTALTTVVVICTAGIFDSIPILQFLLLISDFSINYLPLICEQSFSVPSKDSVKTNRIVQGHDFKPGDINALSVVLTALFKEIAIHFEAKSSSLNILSAASHAVAQRLLFRNGKKLSSISHRKRHTDAEKVTSEYTSNMVSTLSETMSRTPTITRVPSEVVTFTL